MMDYPIKHPAPHAHRDALHHHETHDRVSSADCDRDGDQWTDEGQEWRCHGFGE